MCTDGGAHMMRAAQDVGQAMPLPDVLYNLNRGVDKLRFLRPVRVGSRLRARVRLAGVELLPALEGAMDESTLARVTEALRVRLDSSLGTPE